MKRYSMAGAGAVDILNMRLCKVDESACVQRILLGLAQGKGGWVVTSNLDTLRRHVFEPDFRTLLEGATLVVADGMPLVWASRVQGSPLPARVAGSSLISSLSVAAAQHGRSVFLLGGDPGTAEAAAAALQVRSPRLRIAGTWCPPFGFERDPVQLAAIRDALQRATPDIVYVGLSCPKQEWLISQLKPAFPNVWWLGLGYSFSFLAQRTKRAPRWIQDAGMEWLHRLLQEPRRLARRYLLQGLPFAVYMLSRSLLVRVRKGIGA
jgi:N-acetylglucosaminyldiphosphoundecaprenol N-acetyl-beta-D-mannosaminyltransferase